MSVNAEGAGNARMGVLGQGQQYNIFGGTDNHDVVVVIEHESDEIAVQIDTEKRLSVEITNHTRYAKQLSLRANGVPRGIATLDRTEVVVSPGDTSWVTVTLLCTRTTPKAGRRPLQVVAVDVASGTQWPSDAKTVAIPPRPDVALVLDRLDGVNVPGTYPARVQVSNLGNTMVEGRVLGVPSTGGPMPDMSFPLGRGNVVDFHAAPGESAARDLQLTFPSQGWRRRRWEMSFRLTVDRDDVSDAYYRFWVEQQGRLAELWRQKDQVRAGVPRRGVLLSGLVVVFVVAVVFAIIASLPSREREAADGSGSPGAEISTPAAAVAPKKPAAAEAPPYSPLPCGEEQWIVFLGSMQDGDTDEQARDVLEYETKRLDWVIENFADQFVYTPSQPFKVKASAMDDVCPDLKGAGYIKDTDANRRFIWLDPLVESEIVAQQVCDEIGKPMAYDCLPVSAG